MINRSIISGRIAQDIQLKKTQNGDSVVSFTIACNRAYKKDGKQEADFINCVAWNKTAELMDKYLKKGSLIEVEGKIQTRNYDDRDGKRVYVTEVIVSNIYFLESHQKGEKKQIYNNTSQYGFAAQDDYMDDTIDIDTNDLPF